VGQDAREDVVVSSPHFGRVRTHVPPLRQGPPLLLVHGLMTSSYSFRYVFEPLGAHFETIALDLPGAGRTDKPDVSYGSRELATFLGEAMRERASTVARWWQLDGAATRDVARARRAGGDVAPRRPALARLATARMVALSAVARLPIFAPAVDRLVRRDPEAWAHKNVHYYDETLKSLEEAREYAEPLRSPEGRRAFAAHLRDALAGRPTCATFERRLRALNGTFPVPLLMIYARRDPMVPAVGRRAASRGFFRRRSSGGWKRRRTSPTSTRRRPSWKRLSPSCSTRNACRLAVPFPTGGSTIMSNGFAHIELNTDDPAKAQKFYKAVFRRGSSTPSPARATG